MAELWKLPVVYVIENNQYAMGTAVRALQRRDAIFPSAAPPSTFPASRSTAWMSRRCRQAGAEAMAYCRAGKGPIILEMKTYRYRGHSMSDPAKYRTREEVTEVREKRDPIDHFGKKLVERGVVTEEDLKAIDTEVKRPWSPRPPNSPPKAPSRAWRTLHGCATPDDPRRS